MILVAYIPIFLQWSYIYIYICHTVNVIIPYLDRPTFGSRQFRFVFISYHI
jgi:hypothetical protein